jgi:uncharacterized protein
MKASEGKVGRIFFIRLEDRDPMPATLEDFAHKNNVLRGMAILVGGVGKGSTIVVGPRDGNALPVDPMLHTLADVHEIAGVGTLAPDEEGMPRLHMHATLGRNGTAVAGCIRPGIETWKLGEIILLEMTGNTAKRVKDKSTGFSMLEP